MRKYNLDYEYDFDYHFAVIRLSCIVSTFMRPHVLQACLHNLNLQTEKNIEIIVVDNSSSPEIVSKNRWVVDQMDERFAYVHTQKEDCYSSAEEGVRLALGSYLSFPSDDDVILPRFAELMLANCEKNNLDFTYSDGVYDNCYGKPYAYFNTSAKVNEIDKCSFMVRRSRFTGFAGKLVGKPCAADGLFIESLVKKGYRHAKTDGLLWVHT